MMTAIMGLRCILPLSYPSARPDMDQFIQSLSSSGWWLSVVVVSIITSIVASIIAHYTTPKLDKILSSLSQKYRLRSVVISKNRLDGINWMLSDDKRMLLYGNKITRLRLKSLVFLILTVLLFVGISIFVSPLSTISISSITTIVYYSISYIGIIIGTYQYTKIAIEIRHMTIALERALEISIRAYNKLNPVPPVPDDPASEPAA